MDLGACLHDHTLKNGRNMNRHLDTNLTVLHSSSSEIQKVFYLSGCTSRNTIISLKLIAIFRSFELFLLLNDLDVSSYSNCIPMSGHWHVLSKCCNQDSLLICHLWKHREEVTNTIQVQMVQRKHICQTFRFILKIL